MPAPKNPLALECLPDAQASALWLFPGDGTPISAKDHRGRPRVDTLIRMVRAGWLEQHPGGTFGLSQRGRALHERASTDPTPTARSR